MTELTPQPGPAQDGGLATDRAPLLRAQGLTKHFKIGNALSQKVLHAVDDVNLSIEERRDRRAGRRERQRQVDHRPATGSDLQADSRGDIFRG